MTQHGGFILARTGSSDRVFEVNLGAIEPTGETLGLYRDDERVESIDNDDWTDRTMGQLTTARKDTDFIGVEVPKEFIAEVRDAATEAGRVTDEAAADGYRLQVL